MNFTWTPAGGNDVPDIVVMGGQHFMYEIDTIFTPDFVAFNRNLTHAVVNQFFVPTTELLSITRDPNGALLAYTWAKANHRTVWSDDPMVIINMAHVALDQSARTRVRLIYDMLELWEKFAIYANMPIICSTTMRHDQSTFLKIHSRYGYDVRGSYAYKRVNTTQATPAN